MMNAIEIEDNSSLMTHAVRHQGRRSRPKTKKERKAVPILTMQEVVRSIDWDVLVYCDRQRATDGELTVNVSSAYQGLLLRDAYYNLMKLGGDRFSLFWNSEEYFEDGKQKAPHLTLFLKDFPIDRLERQFAIPGVAKYAIVQAIRDARLVTKHTSVITKASDEFNADLEQIRSYQSKAMTNKHYEGTYGFYGTFAKRYLTDEFAQSVIAKRGAQ